MWTKKLFDLLNEITQRERGRWRENERETIGQTVERCFIFVWFSFDFNIFSALDSVLSPCLYSALHGFLRYCRFYCSLCVCTLLCPWWFRCNMCNRPLLCCYAVLLLCRTAPSLSLSLSVCVCVCVVLLCSNASECAFMNEKLGVNRLLMRYTDNVWIET